MNVEINTKLTNFIKDYLELYKKGPAYMHSAEHDNASNTMIKQVETIVHSGYSDFITVIGT